MLHDAEQGGLQADDLAGHHEIEDLPVAAAIHPIPVGPAARDAEQPDPDLALADQQAIGRQRHRPDGQRLDQRVLAVRQRLEDVLGIPVAAPANDRADQQPVEFGAANQLKSGQDETERGHPRGSPQT